MNLFVKKSADLSLLAFLMLAFAPNGLASKLDVLEIDPKGNVWSGSGERTPAVINIEFDEDVDSSQPVRSVHISVHDQEMELPECIVKQLHSKNWNEILVSGRWLGEDSSFDSFMIIEFRSSKHVGHFNCYMEFDLNLLKLNSFSGSCENKNFKDIKAICTEEEWDYLTPFLGESLLSL